MIADLKPYAEYKESGLPWLGQVPGHWEVKRAKSIFERIDERSKTGGEELLTVSSARGIVPRKSANVTMFKAESYLGYKLCWPGDLVINSLWAWGGGLGVSQHHGIISSAYGVYRIRKNAPMIPSFVHEVVRSSPFNWELHVRSKGVWISRLQLTDVSFLDAPLHMPPPAEQAAIVRFLNWANGRLERAIRAKRKVIALLGEQKQAIIHRAVTRGLDPSVPLKPSGIPWLGDIPQHWEIVGAKQISSVFIPQRDKPSLNEIEGLPWITPVSVGDVFLHSTTLFVTQAGLSSEGHRVVPPGSVIASCVGRFGIASINQSPVVINQQLQAFIPSTSISALYLRHCVQVARPYFEMEGNATTLAYVNRQGFGRMPLPFPPLLDQEEIERFLDIELSSVNRVIGQAHREMSLLREYRTRLVADVVTGKLDVREAAARLPDEVAPDRVEDDTDLSLDPEAADEEAAV